MKSFSFLSSSPSVTKRIAKTFAKLISAPATIALDGDLGAGKTTFVSGFVQGLKKGSSIRVQSPTFALARTYATEPPVHHVDLYRINDNLMIEDLGIENLLDDPWAIILIEWPKHEMNPLPIDTIWIKFTSEGSKNRRIEFQLHDRWTDLAMDWEKAILEQL